MDNTKSTRIFPVIILILAVFVLGLSAIFTRLANAPGVVLSFYRMGIAAVLLTIPFFRKTLSRTERLPRKGIILAVLSGIVFSIDLWLWSTGVLISGATNPTLMANSAPLWVGLGSVLFFGEKRENIFWIGLGLALIGTFLILGQDSFLPSGMGLGSLLGFLASFFYGGYFLLAQKGREYLDPRSFFWITVTSATICLLLGVIISGEPLIGYSKFTYLNFLAIGVIVQVLGWYAINYIQGYLPAAIVSPTLLGQPIITAVIAHFFLEERLSVFQIISGIIALAGILLVHRSRPQPG